MTQISHYTPHLHTTHYTTTQHSTTMDQMENDDVVSVHSASDSSNWSSSSDEDGSVDSARLELLQCSYGETEQPDLSIGIFLTEPTVKEMRNTAPGIFSLFKDLVKDVLCVRKTFEQVEAIMRTSLRDYPALLQKYNDDVSRVLPNNGVFCYTAPGTPLRLMPTFNLSTLALPWENDPDINFSTECALCRGPFEDSIRTLKCDHTFCTPCITTMLESDQYARMEQPDPNGTRFPCPLCRSVETMDTVVSPREQKYNCLLLKLQAKTVKYKCIFGGCESTFVKDDILEHLEKCRFREYQCDKGCKRRLFYTDRHRTHQDCIDFLKTTLENREDAMRTRLSVIAEKEALVRQRENTIKELERRVESLQRNLATMEERAVAASGGGGGGGGRGAPPPLAPAGGTGKRRRYSPAAALAASLADSEDDEFA